MMVKHKSLKHQGNLAAFLVFGITFTFLLFLFQVRSVHAASPSFVRIIHASPDVGTADVFVDGGHLLSNFEFGTVTPYVSLTPGPHKVQVALVGKGAGASAINQTITVGSGDVYTIAALGTQSKGFKLQIYNDNNQIVAGMARLRMYNLSPDTDVNSVKIGEEKLVGSLSYQDASSYVDCTTGTYTLTIATTQKSAPIAFSATLGQNMITSLFAIGEANGTPKLQFISTNVNGIPGMPGTGSDPTAPDPQAWSPSWLLVLLVLGGSLAASGVLFIRRVTFRQFNG